MERYNYDTWETAHYELANVSKWMVHESNLTHIYGCCSLDLSCHVVFDLVAGLNGNWMAKSTLVLLCIVIWNCLASSS
jgi:hypothetical protein